MPRLAGQFCKKYMMGKIWNIDGAILPIIKRTNLY